MKATTSIIAIAATAATFFSQVQAAPSRIQARYASGWCGVHVTQYQKPNPATDSYSLEVTIHDANGAVIGSSGRVGPSVSLTSQLPYTLEISTEAVDADPVDFAYAGQSWNSNDASRCSVGRYDGGHRDMDCGFSC